MIMVHGAGDLKRPSTLAPDLISIPQAAERLGLHADTLYRLARIGQLNRTGFDGDPSIMR